jgi:hypothetical protein
MLVCIPKSIKKNIPHPFKPSFAGLAMTAHKQNDLILHHSMINAGKKLNPKQLVSL